ncbi:MAG: hypothetical protein UU48_C0015G0019 [Candidatus Uhrbacteria bacterium GW2011_GWF2_41_16]|uniref:Uncharacterized protein n=2 Tax=Candidatus Uhriibacteriota TaxID=1752732 RepID=A0A0G0V8S9_9BACT|nr:MAG: hypothetical protein UU35_C0016G0019 [Candidatus Uhrbacteria bacterium GW2011_GWC2_41_11]KKR97443.1 MAG: hypothetical protein UU48_C0015G0019 [Candidatus Uhrbacteria bacterium GW2011_GWF2_41_16]
MEVSGRIFYLSSLFINCSEGVNHAPNNSHERSFFFFSHVACRHRERRHLVMAFRRGRNTGHGQGQGCS